MSTITFTEDGLAEHSPSSQNQDTNPVDSDNEDLEIVLLPSVQSSAAPVQPSTAPVQPSTAPVQPSTAPVQPSVAPGAGTATLVNVRYTHVPLTPMVLDANNPHIGPWYTVIGGKFIGVFEDTGAADKATRKVSCSSHKAHMSQQAAVAAFNAAQSIGDLEVIT